MRTLLAAATLATALGGATLEYHNGQYDIGCGNGMYIADAGCGMDSKVEGIVDGNVMTGCDLCLRILEQDEWFEGCEGSAHCAEKKSLFGTSEGVWLKALPAPSPPSPPSYPPPGAPPPPIAPYHWTDEVCSEGMDPEVCQRRLILGAGGCAVLVAAVVVVTRSSSKGGSQLM